jgi:iron complex transport system substrate-binding protein
MYGPTFTYGNGTYGHDLIELAGGQNIAENASDQYPMIDDEFIIIQNPDIIFYSQGPWTTANVSSISARTGWEAITAVKNGNIFPINEDWVSRGGPRIVDGLEEIQSKILTSKSGEPGFNITSGFEWLLILGLVPVIIVLRKKRNLEP